MFGIGGVELFLILLFGFLIFGPDKLPAMAKTIGAAIAKFRSAQEEMNKVIKTEVYDPNSDEPFKNPLEALAKVGDTAKKEEKAESFSERKARYDKERAAKKAAEKSEAEKSGEAEGAAASATATAAAKGATKANSSTTGTATSSAAKASSPAAKKVEESKDQPKSKCWQHKTATSFRLVAEIIFYFLIVYLTGSSSQWPRPRLFSCFSCSPPLPSFSPSRCVKGAAG